MLFLIIPAIVAIGIFLYFWLSEGEPGWGVAFGILFGLVAALVVLMGAGIATLCTPIEVVDTQVQEVHALADNMQYEGHLYGNVFIVRGHTEEEMKYNYMYMEDGKGFGFNDVPATSSYLNYVKNEGDTPIVKILHYDWDSAFVRWCFGSGWVGHTEYIFYLPQDAEIIDDFTVDFE